MSDQLRGFRVSSAQRGGGWPTPVVVGAVAAFLLAVLLIVFHDREEPAAEPTPTPVATAALAPTSTPSPPRVVEQSSEWVTLDSPQRSPTPWPALPTIAPRAPRRPSPTPRISQCVTFRWSSIQVFQPSAQVKVEINSVNRCGRDIEALELWFEITGWRDGDLIQTARGHPFDPLRRRRSVITTIGLPGSIDWYDEIRVEIVD